MKTELLAFTEQGFSLAQRLAQALDGRAQRCTPPLTLAAWTAQAFSAADALVFVGAVGIAVRAIAPYVRSKAQDPGCCRGGRVRAVCRSRVERPPRRGE